VGVSVRGDDGRCDVKPLGHKAYGSIPHLPGSKRGPGDHGLSEEQAALLTGARKIGRDWEIVVQEKLDGSCMSVAKIDGKIVALGRAGFVAQSSPYAHLRAFAPWVAARAERFDALLSEGERVVGEWMLLATGLRYWIPREDDLFVAFDLMRGHERSHPCEVIDRCESHSVLSVPISWQGATDPVDVHMDVGYGPLFPCESMPEGVIYRAIHKGKVSFLGKWVRDDFEPGRYLDQQVYNYPIQWLIGAATEAA
jgi:hypothetical protein